MLLKTCVLLRQVHLELCKMSKTICTILGVQAAFEIAVSIMFLTGMSYNLYTRYVIQQHKFIEYLTEQTAVSVILGTLTIVKVVFLSRICKNAADEVIYFLYYYVIQDFYISLFVFRGIKLLRLFMRFMDAKLLI